MIKDDIIRKQLSRSRRLSRNGLRGSCETLNGVRVGGERLSLHSLSKKETAPQDVGYSRHRGPRISANTLRVVCVGGAIASLLRDPYFAGRDVGKVDPHAVGVTLGHRARTRREALGGRSRRAARIFDLSVQRVPVLHDDARIGTGCDGGIGFELGAQPAVVRNPVAAERIAHATPDVKLSKGVPHVYLRVPTTQLV